MKTSPRQYLPQKQSLRINHTLLWLVLCLTLTLTTTIQAQESIENREAQNRRFTIFTVDDGLPSNHIEAIHQDQEGFMWIATTEGVVRFDGYHFVTPRLVLENASSQQSPNVPVQAIMEDDSGILWFATESRGVQRYDPRIQYRLPSPSETTDTTGWEIGNYRAIAQDGDGRVFVAGAPHLGLNIYDPTTDTITAIDSAEYGNISAGDIAFDQTGAGWIVSNLGLIRFDDGTFRIFDEEDPLQRARDVLIDREGNPWFGADEGLFTYDVSSEQLTRIANSPSNIHAIVETEDRTIWAGSSDGLFIFDPNGQEWSLFAQHNPLVFESLPEGNITDLFADDGGNIWVGTRNGAAIVNPRQMRFTNQTLPFTEAMRGFQRDTANNVFNAAAPIIQTIGDDIWAGAGNQLIHWENQTPTTYTIPNEEGFVTSLYVDPSNGQIFVGVSSAKEIYAFDPVEKSFRVYPLDLAERELRQGQNPAVRAITSSGDQHLWLGVTWQGLVRLSIETGEVAYWEEAPQGPPPNSTPPEGSASENRPPPIDPSVLASSPAGPITTMNWDDNGDLWLAYAGPGLSRYDTQANEFEHFFIGRPREGEISFRGSSGIIHLNNGAMLISTLNGLIRASQDRETLTLYTTLDGLNSNQILGIIEDRSGDIWLSTEAGLSRFDVANEQFESFGRGSNLPVNQFAFAPPAELQDGKLAFTYNEGLITFDPAEILPNTKQPNVAITEIRLSNEPILAGDNEILPEAIDYADSITLGYDDDFVSFEFASLAFAAPEANQYRYRLDGLEDEWNVVTADRRYATYTDLDGGTYTLLVQGSNEDGVWNTNGTSLVVIVQPPWWETWWFRTMAIVMFIALVWGGVRLRIIALEGQKRQLEKEVARQTAVIQEAEIQNRRLAVLEERQRIGRELHDDIGQVIGFVSVQSQAILNWLRQEKIGPAAATAQQLARVAQDAHSDIRHYILGIREQENKESIRGFLPNLHKYLKNLEDLYGIRVDLRHPDDWKESTPFLEETETQLLRIIQESLNNVRKHAGVDRANVSFTDLGENVLLVISDQGAGFELSGSINDTAEKEIEDAHFGLTIMQERAESCGGTFELTSTPGHGTQILVTVPKVWDEDPEQAVQGLRVMLVDDHQLYMEGIINMLRTRGVNVVGTANNGLEAQKMVEKLQPELVLMDVHMPVCDGLEATKHIKIKHPDIRIVMLTVSADESQLFDALRFGASGYLLKSTSAENFFRMLRSAMRGESVLTPELASKMLKQFAQNPAEFLPADQQTDQPSQSEQPSAVQSMPSEETESKSKPAVSEVELILTFRQRQVLELIMQGCSNNQIAEQLFISESTVKRHVSNLLGRLQLKSRYELSYWYKTVGSKQAN